MAVCQGDPVGRPAVEVQAITDVLRELPDEMQGSVLCNNLFVRAENEVQSAEMINVGNDGVNDDISRGEFGIVALEHVKQECKLQYRDNGDEIKE